MRYDPKRRRDFPSPEDWRLWQALDRMGVQYDKVPFIHPTAAHRENWYMLARVWFDDKHYGYLDWGGIYYITSHSYNEGTKRACARRLAWLKELDIPYLLLNRRATTYEHEVTIGKWMSKERRK